jgi:hypothetical protein
VNSKKYAARRVQDYKQWNTVMMEAIRSSETADLTRAARRSIPEDDILQYQQCL